MQTSTDDNRKDRRLPLRPLLMPARRAAVTLPILLAVLLPLLSPLALQGGSVQLKNGTVITGEVQPLESLEVGKRQSEGFGVKQPVMLIDNGLQKYYVPERQIAPNGVDRAANLSRYEVFHLQHRRISTGTARRNIVQVGQIVNVTPFSVEGANIGQRTVTVIMGGERTDIIQGITKFHPHYLQIESLNYDWEYGIAPSSVERDDLRALLRASINQQDAASRLAIVRYFIQAGLYVPATAEMDLFLKDFPDYAERGKEMQLELRQLHAKQLLSELHERQTTGQHVLAQAAARVFPKQNLEPAIVREVVNIEKHYKQQREQIQLCRLRFGELQAELTDAKQIEAVIPLRATLQDELDFETITRMDAFLQFHEDKSLPAADRLALAYSGWVLGSGHAITELQTTLDLWQARFLIAEYLRSDEDNVRLDFLRQLQGLEGVTPERVEQMLAILPPVWEMSAAVPGNAQVVEVPRKGNSLRYEVMLPIEYTPHHSYPLIVALHPAGGTPANMLQWWGGTAEQQGQSQRRGYIVIAPYYQNTEQKTYDYRPETHRLVIDVIRDAKLRFNIDSDRVFLTGHRMGGEAAFDIGMSHPDMFAGVIPFNGVCDLYGKFYWENAKNTHWYVVGGELDGELPLRNSKEINRMMRWGHLYDVIYTEFVNRGNESYYAEIHKLFDWMDRQRRIPLSKEFEMKILRSSEDRFFWVEAVGLPGKLDQPLAEGVRPLKFSANIQNNAVGRTVIYYTVPAQSAIFWFSPKIVNFDTRIQLRKTGSRLPKYNDYLTPRIEHVLEDFRIRGDRQRMFSVKLEI